MSNNNEYIPYDFEPMDQDGPEAVQARSPKKSRLGLKVVVLALVCAIIGGVGGGALTAGLMSRAEPEAAVEDAEAPKGDAVPASGEVSRETPPADAESAQPEKPETPASTVIHTNNGAALTPKEVYNRNVNAVVGINVTGTSTGTNIWGYSTPFAASGSGFIISEDGYIVTNNHVVESADEITVSLYDGTSYEAKTIGTYPANDVALLKVEAEGLPCVTIGDSSQIAVGDEVLAIGNPLGQLTFTMTVGYVSALDRSINTDGTPINMLQTDAAINSGNSGGPLFDMYGNVVGITTAKFSNNGSSSASIEGIGFAIPINDAMRIVGDLKEYGHVTGLPYLGVSLKDMNLDSTTAAYYNLPLGVYVDSVVEGSCADKAGVQAKDIITALGDKEVDSYNALVGALKAYRAGESSTLTVYRSGETLVLDVTFDERPQEEETAQEQPEEQPEGQPEEQPGQQYDFPFGGDAYRFNPFDFFGF